MPGYAGEQETVPDEPDRADVRRRYQALLAVHAQLAGSPLATRNLTRPTSRS
jgi:hypothetical protein